MKRNPKSLLQLSLLLLLLAFFCSIFWSCTALAASAAYKRADFLLLTRIDALFNLNSDQEGPLKERLKHFHNWHRQQELPRYRRLLVQLKESAHKGYSRRQIEGYFKEFGSFRNAVLQRLHRETEPFLKEIGQQQIRHLADQLEESNEDLEEYASLSSEEREEERVEKSLDVLENWLGELSPAQEKLFTEMSRQLPDFPAVRLRLHKERQRQFILALQKRESEPLRLRQLLTDWMLKPEASLPAYYQRALRRWRSVTLNIMLTADRQATAAQRAHYIEELDYWIDILDRMMATES